MPSDPSDLLSPNDLLQSEFNYIAQSAFQANEDRARVTTFYLVNLGGFAAALYSSQGSGGAQPGVYALFGGLFLILSLSGLLTLLQLVRLRQAWFESIAAMNQLKEYYRARFPALRLEEALRWGKNSAPALHKPWSISYFLAVQVAVMAAASLAAALVYMGLLLGLLLWPAALAVGGAALVGQMLLYRRLLRGQKETRA